MTNEEVLEQQVEALEKLLKLKQAIIEELEEKIRKSEFSNPHITNFPYISDMPKRCSIGPTVDHHYPTTWTGTQHPPCIKCGVVPSTFPALATYSGSTILPKDTITNDEESLKRLVDALKNR